MGKIVPTFIAIICSFMVLRARADHQSIYSEKLEEVSVATFIAPNESDPIHLAPLLSNVPRDSAYLTVGTIRGWYSFALCPNCTDLLLVDRDPGVVYFNRLFALLVRASEGESVQSRMDNFRALFFESTETQWAERFKKKGLEQEYAKLSALLRHDKSAYTWWEKYARTEEMKKTLSNHKGAIASIKRANPLRDVAIFERVAQVVDKRRVAISLLDLTDKEQLENYKKSLKREKIKVGVFDGSNMHNDLPGYPGNEGLKKIFDSFASVSHEHSSIVLTNMIGNYIRVTRQYLKEHPNLNFEEMIPTFLKVRVYGRTPSVRFIVKGLIRYCSELFR